MKRNLLALLCIGTFALSFGQTRPKVFDPLEPLNKTVPPNILVAVDNSGSMNRDTNNDLLMDFRSLNQVWAGTGDFWHFNVPEQPSWDLVPDGSLFDISSTHINMTVTSTPQARSLNDPATSDSVEYVGMAMDIWVPVVIDPNQVNMVITLTHDGTSMTIQPEDQWYSYSPLTGDPTQTDEQCCSGHSICPDNEKCRRYRVCYAFKEFQGQDRGGSWTVTVRSNSPKPVTLDAVHLTFHPLLSKMTVLKTVLQRIINESQDIRLALGTYKAGWYYNGYVFDPAGMYSSGTRYVWWVSSNDPGFALCDGWPAGELETATNHNDLLEWISMDEFAPHAFDSSTDLTPEIMARGYTPIQSCMQDILDGLNGNMGSLSSLAYHKDSFQACRNYAVIFLTDGMCTESGCDNDTIRETVRQIYRSHEIRTGTQETTGTRTYVIGLSMTEDDRDTLNDWADAGDDGLSNGSGTAFMPQDSTELMQALSAAIQEASAQQVAINSDVIFGSIDPELAVSYNPDFGTRTVQLVDADGNPAGSQTVSYPSVSGNIMFTTLMYYPVWEGTVKAYQPMYKKVVGGSDNDESSLYYFENGQYPKLWDSREEMVARLYGTTSDDGIHANGICDALGLTEHPPTLQDAPQWRRIIMIDPADGKTPIPLNNFQFDPSAGKWRPVPTTASRVADRYFDGDISEAEQLIVFLQSRQIGDITYSTPALVNEPEMGFEEWSEAYFNFKIAARVNRLPIVVVGANDCMLHAFNAYTGREVWSIVPAGVKDSLLKLMTHYDPDTNPTGQIPIDTVDYLGRYAHIYGVASSPKIVDINRTYADDAESWSTLIICGLGAGGHSYFAVDVTDSLDPIPHWDTSRNPDYNDMGESWSYPAVWQILVEQQANNPAVGVPAGIFTSGPSMDTSHGKTQYTIDLTDGSLMEKNELNDLAAEEFLMGAPAGILDFNQRFMRGAYFCDTGGGVYRYEHQEGVCKVFQTDNNSPILSTPAVYIDPNKMEWISFGEMGFEDPSNGIYAKNSTLYSFNVPTCSETKNLLDISSYASSGLNTAFPLGGNNGYEYALPTNEILFTNPLVSRFYYEDAEGLLNTQTVTIFVTYVYPETGDFCGQGNSRMYIFGINDLFIGDPEEDGDVASEVGEGRPGNPVRTGITGTVWINTEEGPMRILPLEDRADAAIMPLYFPFSGIDSRRLGAGSWLSK